ncbi:MAG TPA: 3-hydroxyacyl-CoA dehydrogenase NAD-binding domain-containing protein [Myxococcota bacterium]|jgi:3-hydroxybutyryl-CoA dehydrogenase|nr:3-hydroxyacyl-CoA dehydrogenase NAD-binding domain-containing protein [Myxococcota bacterium]
MASPQRHTIGIVGTGTMGQGIAQAAAQAGYQVVFQNRRQESVDRGITAIRKQLERLLAKQKLTEAELGETMERIRGVVPLEELKGCERVIECAPEELDVKRELLQRIDTIVGEEAIIATNTSSLSVTKLASYLKKPGHFVGLHFFNPVPLMKLVEVVRGMRTTDATIAAVRGLAESLGKVPIDVKDSPGFVVNRVLFPMINEAAFALQQSVAEPDAIDECMKLGCNHPLGPLALADLVGLDVVYAILDSLYREYGEPRYAPCLEIKKRVEAGWLGRKTGRGFYSYEA